MRLLGLWETLFACLALGEDASQDATGIYTEVFSPSGGAGAVPVGGGEPSRRAASGRAWLESTGSSSAHRASLMRRQPDSERAVVSSAGAVLLAMGGHADGEAEDQVTEQLHSSDWRSSSSSLASASSSSSSTLSSLSLSSPSSLSSLSSASGEEDGSGGPGGDSSWSVSGYSVQPDAWAPLGCFAQLQSDDGTPGDAKSARDDSCKKFMGGKDDLCRSGLPFYRLTANEMSPGVCKDYCVGKGLDLCGLIANKECRCGATSRISALWGYRLPLPHLEFQSEDNRLPDGSTQCAIIAFKYIGEFVQGGMPPKLLMKTAMDDAYVQSIACPSNDCTVEPDEMYEGRGEEREEAASRVAERLNAAKEESKRKMADE